MPVIPNSEFLVKRRKELGLTQRDIAFRMRQLGYRMNDNHYSRIERGVDHYSNIKLETAQGIARCLEADLDDCFSVEFRTPIKEFSPTPDQKKRAIKESKPKIRAVIGGQLKKIRLSKKVSLNQIGDDLGIYPTYVYIIERGDSSMETLRKYGEYLGVDIDEMYQL